MAPSFRFISLCIYFSFRSAKALENRGQEQETSKVEKIYRSLGIESEWLIFFVFAIPFVFIHGPAFHKDTEPGKLRHEFRHSVFGTDQRQEIELSHTPFEAIGRIELQAPGILPWLNPRGTPICTGTLVSRDLVLTNAHCLLDRESGLLTAKAIWFRPSLGKEKTEVGARALKVWMGTIYPAQKRSEDWALMKLEQPLGDTYGWLDFAPLWEDLPFASSLVSFIAYATDYKDGGVPLIHSNCLLTSFDPRGSYFRHDCDMNAGSSGGPLLWYKAGKPFILAINAAHVTPAAVSYLPTFTPQFANIAVGSTRFADVIESLRKDAPIADATSIASFDFMHEGATVNAGAEPSSSGSASALSLPPAH